MMSSACPILPSVDLMRTQSFYDRLGFGLVAHFPGNGYLILARDGVELHFFQHPDNDPTTSNHAVFLRVRDARALSREYAGLGLPEAGQPRFLAAEDKPWGVCELAVVDPDGTLLRMGHVTG